MIFSGPFQRIKKSGDFSPLLLSCRNESDGLGCILNVIVAAINRPISDGKLALGERDATHDTEIIHKIFHRLPRGAGHIVLMIQTDFDRMGIIGQLELRDFIPVQEAAENAFVDRNSAVVTHGHVALFLDLFQRVGFQLRHLVSLSVSMIRYRILDLIRQAILFRRFVAIRKAAQNI